MSLVPSSDLLAGDGILGELERYSNLRLDRHPGALQGRRSAQRYTRPATLSALCGLSPWTNSPLPTNRLLRVYCRAPFYTSCPDDLVDR